MRLTEAALPVFARHETFHPRYGWFRKAYRSVAADGDAFEREDAPVHIGVGKNMVRSIRFWGLAARLIEESPLRPPHLRSTEFGDRLFGERGWDPWMEDPGTLWLLHWQLLRPGCRLPVWWLAFHEFHAVAFSADDLEAAVMARLGALEGWGRPSRSALKKDVSALLRTYAPAARRGRMLVDDILDAPLRELRLLSRPPGDTGYRFHFGPKPQLPSAVLAACALDYADHAGHSGSMIPLAHLAGDPGGPGRAFRLTETELVAALRPAVERTPGLDLTASAGSSLLSWARSPGTLRDQVLDAYFRRAG